MLVFAQKPDTYQFKRKEKTWQISSFINVNEYWYKIINITINLKLLDKFTTLQANLLL